MPDQDEYSSQPFTSSWFHELLQSLSLSDKIDSTISNQINITSSDSQDGSLGNATIGQQTAELRDNVT